MVMENQIFSLIERTRKTYGIRFYCMPGDDENMRSAYRRDPINYVRELTTIFYPHPPLSKALCGFSPCFSSMRSFEK